MTKNVPLSSSNPKWRVLAVSHHHYGAEAVLECANRVSDSEWKWRGYAM